MRIALIADNVNFPSLPLMKLSAWHKAKGDDVTLITGGCMYPPFDICYVSKTFNLPKLRNIPQLNYLPPANRYVFGGSGYAIDVVNGKEVFIKEKDKDLPADIEHICPDYSLYPKFTAAYGFLTRGCPNACGFCVVKCKEGLRSHKVADLSEWWRGQKEIVLLDPNILACHDRESLVQQLVDSGAWIDYTQGIDARFVDDDMAKLLNRTKIKTIHFAFDLMKNEKAILKGLATFNKYNNHTDRKKRVYMLTNYDTTHEEDLYRVKKIIELGYRPDVRVYQKGTHDQFLIDLQGWCNNPYQYHSCTFEEFTPRVDGKSCKELYNL